MTSSRLAILFIRLAMRFCVSGFTFDYLSQALEQERYWL